MNMFKGNLPELFLDADMAFDIISKREPHFNESVKILELASVNKAKLSISESSLATLIYLSFEIYKLENASDKLYDFILACDILSGGRPVMLQAISSEFRDKDDALQYFTALNHGADYFITSNISDYKKSEKRLPVMTPAEFMSFIK